MAILSLPCRRLWGWVGILYRLHLSLHSAGHTRHLATAYSRIISQGQNQASFLPPIRASLHPPALPPLSRSPLPPFLLSSCYFFIFGSFTFHLLSQHPTSFSLLPSIHPFPSPFLSCVCLLNNPLFESILHSSLKSGRACVSCPRESDQASIPSSETAYGNHNLSLQSLS